MNWSRIWTVTRTDLKQLIQAKDFWIPMLILGGIFFLFVPTILLLSITAIGDVQLEGDQVEAGDQFGDGVLDL